MSALLTVLFSAEVPPPLLHALNLVLPGVIAGQIRKLVPKAPMNEHLQDFDTLRQNEQEADNLDHGPAGNLGNSWNMYHETKPEFTEEPTP